MSANLPVVARCGKDGCPQWVARLRLREPGEPENEVETFAWPPGSQWPDDVPRPRWEKFAHVIPEMRMNDAEGTERMEHYIRQGWLVGWCRQGGHGPRWVRVRELEDALDAGRPVVFAQDEPGSESD